MVGSFSENKKGQNQKKLIMSSEVVPANNSSNFLVEDLHSISDVMAAITRRACNLKLK